MASGGSSGRPGSGTRSFDFGTDDVLCSYDDYANQEASNGRRSDQSAKEFHESRMGRPAGNVYSQDDLSKDDVMNSVENCMKKYADNLLRFLEGISGRLSQLEVYCYKLDRSIGEFRSEIVREQREADVKLKSLEKHLQEVHRSVQIIRDKQELAETQKELTKLQVQKEPGSNEDGVSEQKKPDDSQDMPNHHLALALPSQIAQATSFQSRIPEQNQRHKEPSVQQPAPTSLSVQQDRYVMSQPGTYYPQQAQSLQPEVQYLQPRSQMQDLTAQATPQQPQMVNQAQTQSFPQYQHQWSQQPPQQFTQQAIPPQQTVAPQPQIRPQTPPSYPAYPPHQSSNPVPEAFQGSSAAMQVSYSVVPQPGGSRADAGGSFGYGGTASIASQPPPLPQPPQNIQRQPQPQSVQTSIPQNLIKGPYVSAPYATVTPAQGYNPVYSIDGSRGAQSQAYMAATYPPSNMPSIHHQQLPTNNSFGPHHPGQQIMRNHPYAEMIEKAVSMGYPRDLVASVIQRMGDSGQQVDFNALLDRLNSGSSSGASPRVWSG